MEIHADLANGDRDSQYTTREPMIHETAIDEPQRGGAVVVTVTEHQHGAVVPTQRFPSPHTAILEPQRGAVTSPHTHFVVPILSHFVFHMCVHEG